MARGDPAADGPGAAVREGNYQTFVLTEASREVTARRTPVMMRRDPPKQGRTRARSSAKQTAAQAQLPAEAAPVVRAAAQLAGCHREGAGRARLRDLPRRHPAGDRPPACRPPSTELGTISGIGENKLAKYGQGVLDTLTPRPPA